MGFDFDRVYDRHDTNSLKWDFYEERHHSADELPMWVADMDFKSPRPVLDALHETAERGFFGYTVEKYADKKIVSDWLGRRHGFAPDPDGIVFIPGVCFGLTAAVLAYSEPGEAVMISEPVYYPFSSIVRDVDRKLVQNVLAADHNGVYHIDFDAFERQIVDEQVKIYILCSPQNPVGRVWTYDELKTLGEICLRRNVLVLADEIHADFVYPGHTHTPFASISPEFEAGSLTFTSPSKTFNTAGLQIAEAIIKDPGLRKRYRQTVNRIGYAEVPVMGLNAVRAAYTLCDEWVDELVKYIYENLLYMDSFIREEIPELRMNIPEGTYLPWVDFSGLGLNRMDLENFVRNKARLWLDAGYIFGDSGDGYERFNVACPRDILKDALGRLAGAIHGR